MAVDGDGTTTTTTTTTTTKTGVWREVKEGVSELAETLVQDALRRRNDNNNNNNNSNNNNPKAKSSSSSSNPSNKNNNDNNNNNKYINTSNNNHNNTPTNPKKTEVEVEDSLPPVANLQSVDLGLINQLIATTTTPTYKIWFRDFGGQSVFSSIFNFFMSADVIYFVVFNMADLVATDEVVREAGYRDIEEVVVVVVVVVTSS